MIEPRADKEIQMKRVIACEKAGVRWTAGFLSPSRSPDGWRSSASSAA